MGFWGKSGCKSLLHFLFFNRHRVALDLPSLFFFYFFNFFFSHRKQNTALVHHCLYYTPSLPPLSHRTSLSGMEGPYNRDHAQRNKNSSWQVQNCRGSMGGRCQNVKQKQKEPWESALEAVCSTGVNLACGLPNGLTEIVHKFHFREKESWDYRAGQYLHFCQSSIHAVNGKRKYHFGSLFLVWRKFGCVWQSMSSLLCVSLRK